MDDFAKSQVRASKRVETTPGECEYQCDCTD